MTVSLERSSLANEAMIAAFFRRSVGQWHSDRRYYTLPQGEAKEITSVITVRFLEQGCSELRHLAQLHHLADETAMTCGAEVRWESENSVSGRSESKGSTVFGIIGSVMYRDRGFATSKPITANFYFNNSKTLCLRTEYKGSVFEEELKLIGDKYRTRQTIISRAGEQQMIGQYLEKRLS